MATGSSMQYTIGTALDRAQQQGLEVEVLVEGHWLTGKIAAADGLGVVLDREGVEHFVVRLDRISSVRVGVRAPTMDVSDPVAPDGPDRTPDGAVPMPAPTTDEADEQGQQYLSRPQALSA
jgi:hypothetical protein